MLLAALSVMPDWSTLIAALPTAAPAAISIFSVGNAGLLSISSVNLSVLSMVTPLASGPGGTGASSGLSQ